MNSQYVEKHFWQWENGKRKPKKEKKQQQQENHRPCG